MTITYTLPNFPHVWQLHDPTSDGQPDENANWNCVPASIAAGLEFLTGKSFDADELHDAIYGQGYRGGQAASRYVDYCRAQGVALTAFNGEPPALVQRIHEALQVAHPVILTMPSKWGIPRADQVPGYTTHVGTACGYGPGALRVMNPWLEPPQWHDGDDQYWIDRLCDNQVWLMEREEEALPIGLPAGWTDDGTTLTAPGGVPHVTTAKRQYILTHPWDAANVPLNGSYGIAHGGLTRQDFRDCALVWDGNSVSVVAYGPEVLALRAQIVQLQHQPPAPAPADPHAQVAIQTLTALKLALESL